MSRRRSVGTSILDDHMSDSPRALLRTEHESEQHRTSRIDNSQAIPHASVRYVTGCKMCMSAV